MDLKNNITKYNPRTLSMDQKDLLETLLELYGDLSGVVLNVRTGNLVGGNQRASIFSESSESEIVKNTFSDNTGTIALGYILVNDTKFNYREVDWPIAKEKAANLAANKAGGLWDQDKLTIMLDELEKQSFDLNLTGFNYNELNQLLTRTPKVKDILPEINKENKDIIDPLDNLDTEKITPELKNLKKNLYKHYHISSRKPFVFSSLYRYTGTKEELLGFKTDNFPELVEFFSEKISYLIKSQYLNVNNFIVTSAPRGSKSKVMKKHLATEIGTKVAELLEIEFIEIFEPTYKGVYNKNNKKLKDLKNRYNQIIFIDDIITRGTTLKDCLELLEDRFLIPIICINNMADYNHLRY